MTYRNMPVYLGSPGSSITESLNQVLSDSVSVQYSTSTSANPNSKKYNPQGPLSCSINTQFILQKGVPTGASNHLVLNDDDNGSGSIPFLIKIGDNTFSDCYIDEYSVNVSLFQPVTVNLKATSYDPPISQEILGDYSLQDADINNLMQSDKVIYGHTCELNGSLGQVSYTKINYTKRYSRTPVYTLGSINASRQLVDGIEAEMGVESTGLSSLIDFSGEYLDSDFGVLLKNSLDQSITPLPSIIMESGALITNVDYSAQGGGSLTTNTTIKQIIV